MEIMRSASQRWAGRFLHCAPRRMAASLRQGRRGVAADGRGPGSAEPAVRRARPVVRARRSANLNLGSTSTTQNSFFPSDIALQNGQVVAAGTQDTTTSGTSTDSLAVARLTTGGSLDTTFNGTGIETISKSVVAGWTLGAFPTDIAVQSNGQIVVMANASSTTTGVADFAVIRLNPNGGLDTSFGNNAGVELFNFGTNWNAGSSAALGIEPDGRIVVTGSVFSLTNGVSEFGIARLNTNGTLDTTFNSGGAMPGVQEVLFNTPGGTPGKADPTALVIQPSTSGIVVVGTVTPTPEPAGNPQSNIAVAFVNVNGSFGSDTVPNYNGNNDDTASGVTLEGTQIVIVGTSVTQFPPTGSTGDTVDDLTVTRLNTNGTFDTSFNGTGKFFLPPSVGGVNYSTQGRQHHRNARWYPARRWCRWPRLDQSQRWVTGRPHPQRDAQCRLRHERNGGAGVQGRTYQSPARPIRRQGDFHRRQCDLPHHGPDAGSHDRLPDHNGDR